MTNFENTNWWKYMEEPMRDLMRESYSLLEREKAQPDGAHDFAFVVFSASKAYEGFLKKVLFDLKMINRQQYMGDRFRIGKSLNPHLPKRYQFDWVFARLSNECGGEQMPIRMWETWKMARNRIFHYFPDHHEFITLVQAEDLLTLITETMESVLVGCKLRPNFG